MPKISEETNMMIIEKLVELRKEYHRKVHLPDDNGMYHTNTSDQTVLNEVNTILKWVAAGGFVDDPGKHTQSS